MSTEETTPSPIATGGGGEHFEQHVDAFALALLLVRGMPPIISDTSVVEVHLQARHLGWRTDDLLVIGETGAGERKTLAAQVKRNFTISATNDECRKTFCGMWDDFMAVGRFNASIDRLAVITLHGTSALLHTFNSLLDCARASRDAPDFFRRLELTGYLSKNAKAQHEALQTLLADHTGMPVDQDQYWRFLRVVHVISFDLNTSTSQTEAWALSLLAHVAVDSSGSLATARDSWAALVNCAGAGRPIAASYTRNSLPPRLLERHAVISGGDSQALLALVEHGQTVRDAIRSTIGENVEIDRESLTAALLENLSKHQVVVVSGTAGSGKSALAKKALEYLRFDRPVFAFQAVEFATPHIDETLGKAQTPLNSQRLFALLAAQDRKVILIESVERLLEHSVRDAFSHLLNLAHRDRAIQLVLTCRDYSLETVRSSLIAPLGLLHTVQEVPALTNQEVSMVEREIPNLAPPLRDTRLRSLLRTPYLLDMASRLDWTKGDLPQNERAFREKCWRELIRADQFPASGMPKRREKAFLDVTHRRATELRPYIKPNQSDPEALDSLCRDALIVSSEMSPSLVAPAHDILEDWAIIHWLEDQFALTDAPHSTLAESVGGFPALRRGYRRWLSEQFETEPDDAYVFVLDTLDQAHLPDFFRDDSLVCVLLSENAEEFIEECRDQLLADEAKLLIHVLHMLRVACKESPPWLDVPGMPSLMLVPKGIGRAATLRIVADAIEHLLPEHAHLMLGLVEDWARQVSWKNTFPPGSEAAGRIAVALLPQFDDYGSDDVLNRALEVLLKVPSAVAPEFRALLERARTRDHRDQVADDLAKLILGSPSGIPACRDFPDAVIDLTNARVRMAEAELENAWRVFSFEVNQEFGIRERGVSEFFPASAHQGPFWALLRYHPRKGIAFIIDLLNHAGEWYGTQRWPGSRLEPAWEITLAIPEEESICQWMNGHLYGLFRGMSDGPNVLQSALMALEERLLTLGKSDSMNLESWLLRVLRESNNVMTTGVVASVCIAYPDKAGRAGLALLSSRDLIQCDRSRLASEHSAGFNPLAGMNPGHRLYEQERKDSSTLAHRREDLKALAIRMQCTHLREEVWRIIDRHRSELLSDQDEDTLVWRLALHQMDVRSYQLVEAPEVAMQEDTADSQNWVYFGPGKIEPDIQSMMDKHTASYAVVERHLNLENRARCAWEDRNAEEGADWRALLAEAQVIEIELGEPDEIYRCGPGLVAAVCVRDHIDELDERQLQWCKKRIESEIRRHSESTDQIMRVARGRLQPYRAGANVVPLLLSRQEDPYDSELLTLLALALTHPIEQVAVFANAGVGIHMGDSHKEFVLHCAAAAAYKARLTSALHNQQSILPYEEQVHGDDLIDRVMPSVREAIQKGTLAVESEFSAVDFDNGWGAEAVCTILGLLAYHPAWGESREFFARTVSWLVDVWEHGRSPRHSTGRNFEIEHKAARYVAYFALKLQDREAIQLCGPLLDTVHKHPNETANFIRDLVVEAKSSGNDCFWELWQSFAERALEAPWCECLDREYPSDKLFVDNIFLAPVWKEDVTHWRRLDGNAHRLDQLAQSLPAVDICLLSYSRFLDTIGQKSLPAAFTVLASLLERGDGVRMVTNFDLMFCLEKLLRRHVYAAPHRLKVNTRLRESVLKILDVLVAGGSSAAYRMRDDFVTPLGAVVS